MKRSSLEDRVLKLEVLLWTFITLSAIKGLVRLWLQVKS